MTATNFTRQSIAPPLHPEEGALAPVTKDEGARPAALRDTFTAKRRRFLRMKTRERI